MPLELIPPGGRKGYRFFYVRGTVNGRSIEVSTKTLDPEVAYEFKVRLEARLIAGAGEGRVATFGEAAELYLEYRDPSRNDRRYIAKLVTAIGRKPLRKIRSSDLVNAAAILYPGATNETKNRQVFTPAAAILHYAAENDLCPYIRIKKLKEKRPEARAVPNTVAEIAMKKATGDLKLLVTWLFLVGTRISETLSVRLEKIDRRNKTVRLYNSKDDEWITIPLPPQVMKLLPAHRTGWLFPWRTRGGADKHRRAFCKEHGIWFTFHQCRHTFGTSIVNAGESLDPLPHWKDPKSRARYGRPNLERQRAIMSMAGKRSGKKFNVV